MKQKLNNLYIVIFSISLLYSLLIMSFYLSCFIDKNLLYNLIIKYNTKNYLPFDISNEDLKLISTELIQYISGKLAFLETKVNINNVLTSFFSIRSKIHMSDVKYIINMLLNSCYVSIFLCLFSLIKINSFKNNPFDKIYTVYKKILILFYIIFGIIIIFALFDFNAFFITFHKIAFNNDLWLLDPNEDYIICLLPEKIFMIYGIRIAISAIVASLLPLFCFRLLSKIQLPQEAK